jgi:hypothetical protein
MSRIGDVVIELQSQGVLIPETREPDFLDYAKDYMKTEQYDKEYAEFEKQNIQSFIDSVKEHTL